MRVLRLALSGMAVALIAASAGPPDREPAAARITAAQVEALGNDPEALRRFYVPLNGRRVEVEGIYESGFERESLNGLWVQFAPDAGSVLFESEAFMRRRREAGPGRPVRIPVRCWGVIDTSARGHLGAYPGTLIVDQVELMANNAP